MNCPNEFTLAMYADDELPDLDFRRVREHLVECGVCRDLVAALQNENRALVHAFQEIDLVPGGDSEVETAGMTGIKLGVLVIGIGVGIRAILDWFAGLGLPSMFDWVNPSETTGQLNLVISSIMYFILDGGAMLMSGIETVSFLALNALIFYGIIRIFRRSGSSALLGLFVIMTVIPLPSYALDVRKGSQVVTVRPDETIDDTLVAFGDTVSVDGTVNGDVVAFARIVNIRGTVKGDVFGFGQRIEVSGTVEGNIVGVGQSVHTRGRIMRNFYGFGADTGVSEESQVDGNVTMFAGENLVDGTVGRDLTVFGERLDVHGNVARNVRTRTDRVTILAPARIGGDLDALVRRPENARITDGATIAGKTTIRQPDPRPSRYATISFYIWQCIWLAGAFIVGMILFSLFPALARITLDTGQSLLKAGGIGFLVAIATPVAAIVVGITMIGLPIALLGVLLWLAGIYLAKIVMATFLGRALLGRQSLAAILLVGLVLIFIAVNLPFVGGVINFLLTLIGFGALLTGLYRMSRTQPGLPGSQPAA